MNNWFLIKCQEHTIVIELFSISYIGEIGERPPSVEDSVGWSEMKTMES